MKIPILRVPFQGEDTRYIQESIADVLASGFLTSGKYTVQWEELFAEMVGVKHAVSCTNGTAALELILRGLGIEGKSVIVPTNTFLATALAVMHSGNRVIFADSDPETLSLDVRDVARRITPDTAAVIMVHIGGIISPAMKDLQQVCDNKGIYLVEDDAHAHGSTSGGKQAGSLGVAGGFSFFPTKVFTTGEGGMATTNEDGLAERMKMIRNQGKNPNLGNHISEVGLNFRVNEFTAVVGVQQMLNAERILHDRQRVASAYDKALKDVPGVRPVPIPLDTTSSYYKYVAYLDEDVDRDTLKKIMREQYDVSLTGEVYADLCHAEPLWERHTYCGRQRIETDQSCGRWPACGCDKEQAGFPGAEYISQRHVCLPLYPGLTDEELDHVITSLRGAIMTMKAGA